MAQMRQAAGAPWRLRSAPAELLVAALRGIRPWRRAGTLVLVTEDQAALLEVVRRHLDRDAVTRQRLDAVLLHLARGVGDDFVSGIELHPIPRVGKDLGHESFKLDQFFLGHGRSENFSGFLTLRTAAGLCPAVGMHSFFTMGVIRRPLVVAGHETDAVNALVRRAAFSPSPRFSGVRGRSPRILPMLRVGAMPVVALVSARLFRLRLVAASVMTLTVVTLARTAPAIA